MQAKRAPERDSTHAPNDKGPSTANRLIPATGARAAA